MGTLHWEQGILDKALDCFETGIQLSPTAPNVATTYHIAISETGQYERARKVFEELVSSHPDFRKGRFLLIDVLIRLKAYQAAMDQIEAVLVHFGVDSQLLDAAKTVRAKVGPVTISKEKHPSLSLCMIVKNEENFLARCLASLKPVVDEMIIVDTGSSDATRDIAEVFGAKVFDYEWHDDFAAARNHSLEKASGDWILIMDADEVISPKDHKTLRNLLRPIRSKPRALSIVTRNYTNQHNIIGWEPNAGQYPDEETDIGWIPSEKVRLFPNDQAIRFEYPVHEVVGPSLSRKNIPIVSCPCPVHHYGKLDQNKESQKDLHYFTIGMKKLERIQNDPVPIREMAIQAAKLGKYEDAIVLWKQLIILEPNNARCYINMSTNYGKLKQYSNAKKAAQKAIKLSPKLKEGHLNLGLSELHLGDVKRAEKIFSQILKKHPDYQLAVFLLASCQLCQVKTSAAAKTLSPLKNTAVWDRISYTIQDLLESLNEAGWTEFTRNLIAGAIAFDCYNEKILKYHHQVENDAA
jgi:tetratricopeptide (TPR) repeat protein